jgi:hypothetical protein
VAVGALIVMSAALVVLWGHSGCEVEADHVGRVGVADGDEIGLGEAISRVRQELLDARDAGESEDLRFRLGEVRMEFAVELAREGGGEVGVKLWVVNVGAKGTISSSNRHTVTVTMTPQVKNAAGEWDDVRVAESVTGRPPVPGAR